MEIKCNLFNFAAFQVSEDDLKKIASLPSDYFVHVKEDEKKMAAMVGQVITNHLGELSDF